MTYKQIQAAHEARMWIKDVIIPAVGVGVVLAANPETRKVAGELLDKGKKSVRNMFKKKEVEES